MTAATLNQLCINTVAPHIAVAESVAGGRG